MIEAPGTLWTRLTRGVRRIWLAPQFRGRLPEDLAVRVMDLQSDDRHHSKQGRSTARVRLDGPEGSVTVYLKRHHRLPWRERVAAWLDPDGRHTPAAAECRGIERARAAGVAVPEPVAAGEWIGPWGRLESFLMVAELTGQQALNEALPVLQGNLSPDSFARLKRALAREMAEIVARLHNDLLFHKDLYLCHFFVDPLHVEAGAPRLTLIDLHRLGRHRWTSLRWRCKDLGELLYSSYGVPGLVVRDRLRFWSHYRRLAGLGRGRWLRRLVVAKAARYAAHNA